MTARALWALDGARLAADGEIGEQIDFPPPRRVDEQLRAAGFAPEDVTHVVVSHVHFDHTGGLALFPRARFLLGAGDRDAVEAPDRDELARRADLDPVRDADRTLADGDRDVFGDGSVVVLAMPGPRTSRWAPTPTASRRRCRCAASTRSPASSTPRCG